MHESITYTRVAGAEIEKVVELIENSTKKIDTQHLVMACLAIAVLYHIPNISGQQLVAAVKGASEWIVLFSSSQTPIDPKLAN